MGIASHGRGWRGVVVACAVFAGGCSAKDRKFVSGTGEVRPDEGSTLGGGEIPTAADGGARAAGSAVGAVEAPLDGLSIASEGVGAPLGTVCLDAAECESRSCVDGVCCESACTDLCATCSAPGSEGTCSAASGDAACVALSCAGDTECLKYDQSELAFNCQGFGSCRSAVPCEPLPAPEGDPCQGGAGTCDGLGQCLVPNKLLLGAACTSSDQCSEGHCVTSDSGASVCCDAACDGLCQACGADGRCNSVPPTDEGCEPVQCPPDDVCRNYPDALTENLCRAVGRCATAQDCQAAFAQLRPSNTCQCDEAGSCGLVRGATCSADADCAGAGICTAAIGGGSVCCATRCGAGLFCSSDGANCVQCEGSAITCEGNSAKRCQGGSLVSQSCQNGCTPEVGCNALPAVGFTCAGGQCQAGAVCQSDVAGTARCCTRNCGAEGRLCAADGGCVCPQGQVQGGNGCFLRLGDPCGSGAAQCDQGLTCADGVCCNGACAGACERCNVAGNVGQCVFDSADTAQCAQGERCLARADCALNNREACGGNADCASSNCEPLVGVANAQICCARGCSGTTSSCSSDGARCVQCASNADCANDCNTATGLCNPLRAAGDTCVGAGQCQSGACIPASEGGGIRRCCAGCATGQLCDSRGRCQDPPGDAGAPCGGGRTCAAPLTCVDNVCCQAACNGACQQCGSGGVCSALASDPPSCPALNCGASSECRTITAPTASACSGFGQCAECRTQTATQGTDCGNDGDCDSQGSCQPNRVSPVVDAASLRGTAQGLDAVNLFFTAASDDRTAPADLEYAVFHAEADTFGTNPSQMVSGAQPGGPIRLIRPFSTATSIAELPVPSRRLQHFFIVVVRDRSGNLAAYNSTSVNYQEPATCTTGGDCISGTCLTLFADVDLDCRGDVNSTIRRCSAPAISTGSCPQPRTAVSGLVGVQSGTTRFINNSLDCLDTNSNVFSGQTARFSSRFSTTPPELLSDGFDYNCNGRAELEFPIETVATQCRGLSEAACLATPTTISPMVGCGQPTALVPPCIFVSEAVPPFCLLVSGGPVTQRCR